MSLYLRRFWKSPCLKQIAKVAQLVEHDLAKVGVAGSNLVSRSKNGTVLKPCLIFPVARVVELVDTQDLKSCGQQCSCGFKSRPGYKVQRFLNLFLF